MFLVLKWYHAQTTDISQRELPRCQKCYGYLNLDCMFDSTTWQCPLCLYRNKYKKEDLGGRYLSSIERSRRAECVYSDIVMDTSLSAIAYPSSPLII